MKHDASEKQTDKPGLTFQKKHRLLEPSSFDTVFSSPSHRSSNTHVLILAKKTRFPYARLGLVVPKKKIPRAVDRNRFKRLSRELFRYHMPPLAGYDLVFLARKNIRAIHKDKQHQMFQSCVDNLLRQINQKPQNAKEN